MSQPFRRVLVKLSGEALAAPDGYWLHPPTLASLAEDIARVVADGLELALVVGGGNVIRGARVSAAGWIDRATGAHRIFASGLRNPNGMAWQPQSGALWTAVNERDEIGDEQPDRVGTAVDPRYTHGPSVPH